MSQPIVIDCKITPPDSWGKNSKRAFVTKSGKAVVVGNPREKSTKELLVGLFQPYQPETPITGPLFVRVDVRWPWLASTPNLTRMSYNWRYKATAPDMDAVLTTVLDVLQSLRFFENDKQVAVVYGSKTIGAQPGIRVEVSPL